MTTHIGIRTKGIPSAAEILYFDEITFTNYSHGIPPKVVSINDLVPYIDGGIKEAKLEKKINRDKFIKNIWGKFLENQEQIDSSTEQKNPKIDFLYNAGVLVDFSKFLTTPMAMDTWLQNHNFVMDRAFAILALLNSQTKSRSKSKTNETINGVLTQAAELQIGRAADKLFEMPIRRTIETNPDYLPTSIINSQIGKIELSGNSVLEVTLKNFPLPSNDIPLEKLIEFRSNDNARQALQRLRRWSKNITKQNLNQNEIQDQLEEHLEKYTSYMKLQKMKYRTSQLKTIVSLPAEAIDNLLRVKFKPTVEALFTLKERKLELTEAEMNAPGREVAYIAQVKEKFGK